MANFGSQMGSFIPRDQLWGVLVKLAPWGAAHCNSLRPGRRCLARTESSTAVRGIARAPPATHPRAAMASTHPTSGTVRGYRWHSNELTTELRAWRIEEARGNDIRSMLIIHGCNLDHPADYHKPEFERRCSKRGRVPRPALLCWRSAENGGRGAATES